MSETNESADLVSLTADVVAAYVGNNSVALTEVRSLISQVHSALAAAAMGAVEKPVQLPKPAVSIKKSLHQDFIVCLEDGKTFKSLRRHLRTKYDMSPEEYRTKWGLPADYPMVAPSSTAARSELAKRLGLGQQRRKVVEASEPAKKGRKGKAG